MDRTVVNKSLSPIHDKFMDLGWQLKENSRENIIYVDPINENDEFCIRVNKKDIDVTVPIPNSNVQYKTTLADYFTTCEYLEMHLKNFIEKESRLVKQI